MSKESKRFAALRYHEKGQPGKIEVVPTKMLSSQRDLALAYSPGVAEPCLEIAKDVNNVYRYTAKGNLVAVISNGTAVLGLGDIGPEASKPVMEGKGVLFKKFAGIDVFDIEVDEKDPDKFIDIVKALEPTFGGVNLEDIKAPESFKIEQTLRKKMNIPVMHDDQHGTAIISAAALLSALEICEKKIGEIKIVVNGAGAAAVSCTLLYISLGANPENIVMVDSKGVIRKDRENLTPSKAQFATDQDLTTLAEAVKDADMFLGLSTGDVLSADMLKTMAPKPIVFALANPTPEIDYDLAISTRDDIIMATGRSDHPNQVNNVLGFPFIFRGALDVRASEINEAMKLATVKALAELAHEPVPEIVNKAYGGQKITFGKEYLIPKPLDPRLITKISPAVAKAAIDSGVAKSPITDWIKYEYDLQHRVGVDQRLISVIIERAKKAPKRIVFPEGDNDRILIAASVLKEEGICEPILLGSIEKIKTKIETLKIELECQIIDPLPDRAKREEYGDIFWKQRARKGVTRREGRKLMRDRNYFGSMMVEQGEADAVVSGITKDYPSTVVPALNVIGKEDDISKVIGMYLMVTKKGPYLFADTTLNLNPSVDDLVDTAGLVARAAKFFNIEPRIAFLSYSNFGSSKGEIPEKMAKAAEIAQQKYPNVKIEGDLQANVALDGAMQESLYPFSKLAGTEGANALIFPSLASGNIAYKLLMELGGSEAIGPILIGMKKPVHVLQMGCTVRDIINMASIAVVDAQDASTKSME